MAYHGREMRVLVVDDQPESTRATCLVLTLMGHECQPCISGADALSTTFEFRAAFIDIGLPDISGYAIAEQLRARGCGALLVALTGWDDLARARAAGFDELIVKPADAAALQRVLALAR